MGMALPCVPFVRDGDIGATDKDVILTAVTDIINRPVNSLLERIACRDLQNLIDYASERTCVDSEILVLCQDLVQVKMRNLSQLNLLKAVRLLWLFRTVFQSRLET
jgi:hypothetical protein